MINGLYDPQTGAMDPKQVLAMLPHRYPFLLVDNIASCSPGKRIIGFKNIANSECSWRPSGDLALPHLLVLEALAQVSLLLTFRTLDIVPTGKEQMFFAGIDDAKFMSPVGPGDRVQLVAEVMRVMPSKGIGKFRTSAYVKDRLVAGAVMMAVMRLH